MLARLSGLCEASTSAAALAGDAALPRSTPASVRCVRSSTSFTAFALDLPCRLDHGFQQEVPSDRMREPSPRWPRSRRDRHASGLFRLKACRFRTRTNREISLPPPTKWRSRARRRGSKELRHAPRGRSCPGEAGQARICRTGPGPSCCDVRATRPRKRLSSMRECLLRVAEEQNRYRQIGLARQPWIKRIREIGEKRSPAERSMLSNFSRMSRLSANFPCISRVVPRARYPNILAGPCGVCLAKSSSSTAAVCAALSSFLTLCDAQSPKSTGSRFRSSPSCWHSSLARM